MGIFNFGKKKKTQCDCAGACDTAAKQNRQSDSKEEMAQCECGNMCPVSEIEAKKAAQQNQGGCCSDISSSSIENAKENMQSGASVKVLGSGCKKCNDLEQATKQALESLNMNTDIDHVTDFAAIASYGVMTTPALVVDGKVVSYGKVLKTDEVVQILKKVR